MKKIILFNLLALSFASAEISQVSPQEELDHYHFWPEGHQMEGEVTKPEGTIKVKLTWDNNPDHEFLYMQAGIIVMEGEEGFTPWEDEDPDSPFWRLKNPDTNFYYEDRQVIPINIYPMTKEANQIAIAGEPVIASSRELMAFYTDISGTDLALKSRIRFVGFKNGGAAGGVGGPFVAFDEPWTSIQPGEWSAELRLEEIGDPPPKVEGFKVGSTQPLVFEFQASRTMEVDSWNTVMVYAPPAVYDKEFFRLVSNGQVVGIFENQ